MESWRQELYASDYGQTYLAHHGIEGQKWGRRRWQYEDGSLTPEGYVHYGVNLDKARTEKDDAKKEYKRTKNSVNKNIYRNKKEAYKDEVIKNKLNSEKKKSKHRLKLEDKYKSQGMNDEEAAIAAYKKARTEKIVAGVAAVTAAAAVTAGVMYYRKYNMDEVLDNASMLRMENNGDSKLYDFFYAVKDTDKRAANKYKGIYGKQIEFFNGKDSVYQKHIDLKGRNKIAGKANGAKALQEYVGNDGYKLMTLDKALKNINNHEVDPRMKRLIKRARHELSQGKVGKNVYEALNVEAPYRHQSASASDAIELLTSALKAKGYAGMKDINDQKYSGYNVKSPIIIFDAGKAAVKDAVKIGAQELNKAYIKEIDASAAKSFVEQIVLPSAGIAVGVITKNNISAKANDRKIVENYKSEHPNTEMSSHEIIDSYYRSLKKNAT